jgi:hypothetical protein
MKKVSNEMRQKRARIPALSDIASVCVCVCVCVCADAKMLVRRERKRITAYTSSTDECERVLAASV